jgi:hypothetical protein
MKTILCLFVKSLIICAIYLQTGQVKAQTVLFEQDFETSPVINILNNWGGETQLPEGPSTCSKGSRGNTADFNSASVDFNSTQNPGYFLGVNPQSPCGGYYTATLITDSLDFSMADSLVFRCSYFITNTIGWGAAGITVSLNDFIIQSEFSSVNNWDTIEVAIPDSIISDKVLIEITMGGGEAAGIDNIEVLGYVFSNVFNQYPSNNVKLYPVPADDILVVELSNIQSGTIIEITDIQAKVVLTEAFQNTNKNIIDIGHLKKGIYFAKILSPDNIPVFYKIIIN